VTSDRFGQEKPHPAVGIERMASLACSRLLADVLGKREPSGEPQSTEEENFYT
jgi:hypothetical protein